MFRCVIPFACRALTCAVLVSSLSAAETSPCASRYGDWLGKKNTFIRRDQPKNLQGFHVVCLWEDEAASTEERLQLEAFPNGVETTKPLRKALPLSTLSGSWQNFRHELKSALGFKKRSNKWKRLDLKQPFGIFNTEGVRLGSAAEVSQSGLVLVIEGGQWYWPPVRKGFTRQVGDGLELETLSVQPVVFRVRGFLREEEVEQVVALGQGHMKASPVSLMDKDKGKAAKEFRTSTQAQIHSVNSPTLQTIDQRISRLTRIPVAHNEAVQILRYEKTQYYAAHLDNWDPEFYSDAAFVEYGHKNRLITVFWYLSNVTKGGETLFPRADGLPQPADMWSCKKGLKVTPEVGSVIFWYSLHANGNTDPNGLHGACPVKTGEKWSANYWVWNKPLRGGDEVMPDMGVDEPDDDQPRRSSEL